MGYGQSPYYSYCYYYYYYCYYYYYYYYHYYAPKLWISIQLLNI